MAPTQKRKADDGPLSPNTKRARKKVVNELAEKVYAIQVLDSSLLASELVVVENNGVRTVSNPCLNSHRIVYIFIEYLSTTYV
jgi:hypothetical protein